MNSSWFAMTQTGRPAPIEEITQIYAKPVNDLYCRAQQKAFLQHHGQDEERERVRETLRPAVIFKSTTLILLCRHQPKMHNKI